MRIDEVRCQSCQRYWSSSSRREVMELRRLQVGGTAYDTGAERSGYEVSRRVSDPFGVWPAHADQSGPYERCCLCGRLTDVCVSEPIQLRRHYVPGAGQPCAACYREVYHTDDLRGWD